MSLSVRSRTWTIEKIIRNHPLALTAIDLDLFHHFLPGLYARELHVPAGMITVGKIHKYPCVSLMPKGVRSTLVDGAIKRVEAPYYEATLAGSKRVSFTHEDCIWYTIHITAETDIKKLEHDLVASSEAEYEDFCRIARNEELKCLS